VSPVHTSLLVPYLCPLKDRLEPAGPSREQGEVSPSDPWGQVALVHQRAWKVNSPKFALGLILKRPSSMMRGARPDDIIRFAQTAPSEGAR
jgi:hypothetical protein